MSVSMKCWECLQVKKCDLYERPHPDDAERRLGQYLCRQCAKRLGYEPKGKRIIAAIVIAFALLAWHGAAQAGCRSWSYYGPDGTIIACTVCCWGGSCQTTCQ